VDPPPAGTGQRDETLHRYLVSAAERRPVPNRPARSALVAALTDWRRNAAAAVLVVLAVSVAAVVASPVVAYAAVLVAFAVWMAWFVWTAVDWLDRADF
jgi:hypothetical protein